MKSCFAFLAFSCAASVATAQLNVVSFGGTGMVGANQALGGNGEVLNASASISPASGYTGQTFYGGATNTGNSTITGWSIFNELTPNAAAGQKDWIGLTGTSATDTASKFHTGLILFKQADFLELSGQAGGVVLDSISMHAKRTGGNPSSLGFVVQTALGYFITTKLYNDSAIAGNGGEIWTLGNFGSVTWREFTPETSLRTIGATATPDFGNVIAAGVWFDNERADTSTANFGFYVSDIQITAIPEPSAFAALAGLGVLGLAAGRRRRRV